MKKILITLLIIFPFSGCNDVLDIDPLDRIAATEVWKDASTVRLYMNATYATAFPQALYRNTQIGHATDEMHSIKGSVNYVRITKGELTPDNVTDLNANIMNNWKQAYATIRNVNVFLEEIGSSPIDANLKTTMTAEMRFIRAHQFAQLIWRYGGVPLITYVFKLNDDFSRERNTYDECVAFIIDELDEVIGVLPDKQPDASLGLASSDAARALKSRVLLYAASPLNNTTNDLSKWQAASDAAKEIIDDNHYTLNSDYRTTFIGQNSEVIFARYFTQAAAASTDAQSMLPMELHFQVGRNGDRGWGSDTPTQNHVDAYEMNNGLPISDGASGYDPTDPYVNRDPRFYATILFDGAVWKNRATETFISGEAGVTGGMDTNQGPFDPQNATQSGYYSKKFLQEEVPPLQGSTVRSTSPYIMFRFAEILLNYAEAQYMLGNEGEARDYVNMVRSRPGVDMPDITEGGAPLLARIQNERRIELAFEGHRYFDVRRWKIAPVTESADIMGVFIKKMLDNSKTREPRLLIDRPVWDDKWYLLPIPRAEINRSVDSEGDPALIQNPGYN
ncbi:MAG TPA: RagB/SusD family nutrient uptake outer membrane protein [Ohtaekwangia sp.]